MHQHSSDQGPTHDHAHDAGDARGTNDLRRLAITLALASAYMVAEAVAGLAANSLALLADAGHMLSDVGALALSLFAIWFARRPPDAKRTFGYYRAEILAALLNGATLLAISLFIFVEAYQRLRNPPAVQGALLMGVAVGGLAVNLAGLWILRGGKDQNLNVRGAWLHVLTDTFGSVGAIVAGVLVWARGWNWADPAVSVLIGLLVVYSSWSLLKASVAVLMESTPRGIDLDEVRDAMRAVPGVGAVHDLHVWTITRGIDSLSAHVVASGPVRKPTLLAELRRVVRDRFGIDHVTLQVEPEEFDEGEVHA
jgi:cobalt-zinc-cadmium efflux system protein